MKMFRLSNLFSYFYFVEDKMLSSMARRPPAHVHHMNGLHHQPYQSKSIDDDDDNEDELQARRAHSRILVNKLSESLLNRSSSMTSTHHHHHSHAKDDSMEQRIKTAIDHCDVQTLKYIYQKKYSNISIERCFKCGGWTALIHAAYACHSVLVRLFVCEFGADVNQTDSEGLSPLMACCMSSHSKSSTNDGNEEQLEICRFLLEKGALIEPTSKSDNQHMMSPLLLAARFGCSSKLIELLVSHGANIEQRDSKGWTPLIMATQHGHLASVQALVKLGADLYSMTDGGLTALDMANHLKHDQIVKYLAEEQRKQVCHYC